MTAPGPQGAEERLAKIPFGAEDDARIASMGRFMSVAAMLAALTAVFQAVSAVLRILGFGSPTDVGQAGLSARATIDGASSTFRVDLSIPAALVAVGLAIVLLMAGAAFRRLATTDGSDQDLLAEGLRKLRLYFLVKSVLIMLALVFVCVIGPILSAIVGGVAAAGAAGAQ